MVSYERFDAWKVAHQLALKIYSETERWPINERYGLTAQVRRAALSAPTNIAERSAKRGPRELRRYLDIALGSLSEVSYLLRFSRDRGILKPEAFLELDDLRNPAGQLTWRFYASLNGAPSR
jgi:four helix bundle protein